jgi:hypothetical protein
MERLDLKPRGEVIPGVFEKISMELAEVVRVMESTYALHMGENAGEAIERGLDNVAESIGEVAAALRDLVGAVGTPAKKGE